MNMYPRKKFIHIPSGKMYRVLNGKVEMLDGDVYVESEFDFRDLYNKELFKEA